MQINICENNNGLHIKTYDNKKDVKAVSNALFYCWLTYIRDNIDNNPIRYAEDTINNLKQQQINFILKDWITNGI